MSVFLDCLHKFVPVPLILRRLEHHLEHFIVDRDMVLAHEDACGLLNHEVLEIEGTLADVCDLEP